MIQSRVNDQSFKKLSTFYKIFAKMCGLLPFESRSFDFVGTRLSVGFMTVCSIINSAVLIGNGMNTYLTGKPLKVELIYTLIITLGTYYRYNEVLYRREQFAELFAECKRLWQFCNEKGRATVKSYESKIRKIYGVYVCSCFVSNFVIPLDAYMMRLPSLEPNATVQRVLPYIWYTEDDPYALLGYHATFLIQVIYVHNCIVCACSSDVSVAVFIMLGAGYFHHLRDRLLEQFAREVEYREIMRCIRYHKTLYEYCHELKSFSKNILLSQLISSCYSISLILIRLLGSDPDKYDHLSVLVICMCALFMIQWAPDCLCDESEKVSFAVFTVVTRQLGNKQLQRNLQIMLARAQKPVQFMAGDVIELSLRNFAAMMKGAFSFFTVLRNFDIQ